LLSFYSRIRFDYVERYCPFTPGCSNTPICVSGPCTLVISLSLSLMYPNIHPVLPPHPLLPNYTETFLPSLCSSHLKLPLFYAHTHTHTHTVWSTPTPLQAYLNELLSQKFSMYCWFSFSAILFLFNMSIVFSMYSANYRLSFDF
jgi:hypothetical protein